MTQPDGGQSPYDPPQQPQQPEQGQQTPPGAVPGQPAAYEQSPYQQQAPQGPVYAQPAQYEQSPYQQQAQQGPTYAQGAQPYAYGAAPLPKNSLGVWSLVLGILSVLGCGLLTGIAAVITGSKSRKAQQEGQADNGGMGLAGIITGWVGIAWTTVYFGFLIVLAILAASDPSFQQSFESGFESGYSEDY